MTGWKLTKNSNRRCYSTERLNNCLKSEIHGIHKPPKIKSGAKVIVDKWKGARESIYAKKEINELQDSPQLRIHFVYIAFLYVLFFFFRFSFDQVVVVVGLFFFAIASMSVFSFCSSHLRKTSLRDQPGAERSRIYLVNALECWSNEFKRKSFNLITSLGNFKRVEMNYNREIMKIFTGNVTQLTMDTLWK